MSKAKPVAVDLVNRRIRKQIALDQFDAWKQYVPTQQARRSLLVWARRVRAYLFVL